MAQEILDFGLRVLGVNERERSTKEHQEVTTRIKHFRTCYGSSRSD